MGAARGGHGRRRRRRPGRRLPLVDGPCAGAAGPGRRGRKRVGSGLGPAQSGRIGFFSLFFLFFFSEFIPSAKTNPGNIQKLFKGTKNTPKITKIPGKFLEID
jgi:hypothetical protein